MLNDIHHIMSMYQILLLGGIRLKVLGLNFVDRLALRSIDVYTRRISTLYLFDSKLVRHFKIFIHNNMAGRRVVNSHLVGVKQ